MWKARGRHPFRRAPAVQLEQLKGGVSLITGRAPGKCARVDARPGGVGKLRHPGGEERFSTVDSGARHGPRTEGDRGAPPPRAEEQGATAGTYTHIHTRQNNASGRKYS